MLLRLFLMLFCKRLQLH
nr:unnamed protein product [Callosobruchus analis]